MKHLVLSMVLVAAVFGYLGRAGAETLTVKISGLNGKTGVVRVMLWKDAAGFPTRPEQAVVQKSVAVSGPEAELVFSGLTRGTYAAAGYLDENNNGKLDRSVLGWPVEPTAASNGARGLVGPPSFADAAFEMKQATQAIRLIFK